jgi:hypothetical protein
MLSMASGLSSVPYEEFPSPEPGTGVSVPPLLVPARLAPLTQELERLGALAAKWNSYNSKPVTPVALRATLLLLVALDWQGPLPTVTPTPPGGVQLEWGKDDEGVEVEVRWDGSVTAVVDVDGKMEQYELSGPRDPRLGEILRWAEKLA